ncbi:MAG: hypothetical protein CL777_00675 [Chloroflexi bacterium]|nr:hypothetical protein [Chloroflexota bacterium]MBD86183.1 hypothetical protein [Chloroflexota bacterium]MBI67252.1 hypothetical protein [Chloroflexota bacterium]MCH2532634.1 hypothetical protein [Dehalococcoidia bacterium]
MISLIRLLLRVVWLVLLVLGIKRALEIAENGTDALAEKLESGEGGSLETSLARLHSALHKSEFNEDEDLTNVT